VWEHASVSRNAKRSMVYGSVAWFGAVLIFAAVFGGVQGAAVLLSIPDRSAYLERTYVDAERTLTASIDPRFQSKAEEIGRVLARLVVIGAVEGAAMFDESGHLQDAYGEPTETSFETIERTGRTVYGVDEKSRAEYYLTPTVTGTPYHLLVRVDIGEISGLEGMSKHRALVIALAGAGAGALMTLVFVWFAVARPVRRINAAVDKALANPALADVGAPLHGGRSEMGMLANGIERFRSSLADIWRTKVMVADAILEMSPFAVVQLASDGSPIFGNPAAAGLFDRDVVRTQSTSPLVVRDVESGQRAVLREHLEHHRGETRVVEIATGAGPHFALAGSLVVGAETRTPTTVVMFADVGRLHGARLDADRRQREEAARSRTLVRREAELKLMLETCISLMGGGAKAGEVHIDVTPFAYDWLETAREHGLVGRYNVTPEGPTVAGTREDLKAVVRLGLLVAYARSGTAPVDIEVDARGINFETAGVSIKATAPGDGGAGGEPVVADWQLALAALRAAVKRVGGQMSEIVVGDDGVTLKFVLRGAAERLTTGMKAAR
jgi:hypothetical protein